MSQHDFYAVLNPGSERYQDWLAVFGSEVQIGTSGSVQVPITTPIPEPVILPIGRRNVFFVKLAMISERQLERMKAHLCHRFGIDRAELDAEFAKNPGREVPILDSDLTVTVLNPQRWLT